MRDDIPSRLSSVFPGVQFSLIVQAPGRVNLIGEHTDYNGFPVLPMALDRCIWVGVRPRRDQAVRVVNSDPTYQERVFQLERSIAPYASGDWGNYIKAAVQGVIDWPNRSKPIEQLAGCDLFVHGDIPVGAGLSSSSALVVASALAFLEANGIAYDRIRLAEMLAQAEHYVGTQGGGMDQAICLLGQSGKALKIDFFPLRTQPVPIPAGWSIVVCNSLIRAEKTLSALPLYNRRPIECRIAAAMLEAHLRGLPGSAHRLADLCRSPADIPDLLRRAEMLFREDGYGWREIADSLGETTEATTLRLGRMTNGTLFDEPEGGFLLRRRVRHVLTEAMRVEKSVRYLQEGDAARFGSLMTQSHRSCRDDYEISCPELDVLVQTALSAGASGSRLTGAGFGGCIVSLVRDDRMERFRIRVWEEYYARYLTVKRPDLVARKEMEEVIFMWKPACGAQVRHVSVS